MMLSTAAKTTRKRTHVSASMSSVGCTAPFTIRMRPSFASGLLSLRPGILPSLYIAGSTGLFSSSHSADFLHFSSTTSRESVIMAVLRS